MMYGKGHLRHNHKVVYYVMWKSQLKFFLFQLNSQAVTPSVCIHDIYMQMSGCLCVNFLTVFLLYIMVYYSNLIIYY